MLTPASSALPLALSFAVGFWTLLSARHKLAVYRKPALLALLVLAMGAMVWQSGAGTSSIGVCLHLAYSFCLLVAVLAKGEPRLGLSERLLLFAYLAVAAGLATSDIRVIYGALLLSLLPYMADHHRADQAYRRRLYSFLACNIVGYFVAFACLYADLEGFVISNGCQLGVASLAAIYISALMRVGLAPLHAFHRLFLPAAPLTKILVLVNPLALYPLLLLRNVSHTEPASLILDMILYYGLFNSFYFAIASFQEEKFSNYLFYIASSLLSLMTVCVMHLETETIGGLVYFLANTMVALAALAVCLGALHLRYGDEACHGMSGFATLNRPLAYTFLFFVLVVSNIPMTISFLGEDIVLYEMFKYRYGLGISAVLIFSLLGISLYRFYTQTFCGTPQVPMPMFPLLMREKAAIFLLVAAIVIGPFVVSFS